MLYNPALIATTDFINGSATATTTAVVTIPANRYFSFDIQLSANVTIAGTATPRVTYTTTGSTGASPANGSVVARLDLGGLALTTTQATGTVEFSGYSGDHAVTLDFNIGGASGASCVINGLLF
jgi:hypothetical protein